MLPVCTCGTELPEGARFCFRCGKPQREEDIERMSPAISAVVPPPLPATQSQQSPGEAGVTFANPLALRTALFIACLTTGLEVFPPLLLVAPLFGGLAAVMLFQKRIGRALPMSSAVKLGWMTAILNTILGTVAVTVTALMDGLGPLRDAMRQQAANNPQQQQALQMMNDPFVMAAAVFLSWLLVFALISALCIAGGAIGARFARPRTS
jgi:hypothetical protein